MQKVDEDKVSTFLLSFSFVNLKRIFFFMFKKYTFFLENMLSKLLET